MRFVHLDSLRTGVRVGIVILVMPRLNAYYSCVGMDGFPLTLLGLRDWQQIEQCTRSRTDNRLAGGLRP